MDERTRRTSEDSAPQLRRDAPEPDSRLQWIRRHRIALGAVALLLVLSLYEATHWAKAPSGRFPQGPAQTVGAATVVLGKIRVIVNALGTVTPLATVTVQTQINGQLTDVKFTEGQLVNKGDWLAQIDDRPYQILKAQYEGQLAHDEGLLAQAQMDFNRYQTLVQQNSIARQQADDQRFLVQQYEGTVKQDQALIDTQVLNITYCRIVSPVTGRVGLRLVDPGNYVQTTSTSGIAVITQLQPITVLFTIPEDDLPEIMPQITAGTPFLVSAYDRANLHELATGRVSAVDNQVDVTTGTVKVRAQFDNTDNALFPNQFVNARLLVETLQDVVTVPTSAIQRGSPGAYVYVINADSTVSVRQIRTGPVDENLTAVNSGLSAGERVVTDGTDRLRDGMRVVIAQENGQANGPGNGQPGGPAGGRARSGGGQGQGHYSGRAQGAGQAPPSGGQ
jgi:multidrug efflux system membrane fusion protein